MAQLNYPYAPDHCQPGERVVFNTLKQYLSNDYQAWYEPTLYGERHSSRPDFVVLGRDRHGFQHMPLPGDLDMAAVMAHLRERLPAVPVLALTIHDTADRDALDRTIGRLVDVYGRVARVILDMAREEGRRLKDGRIAFRRATHQEIANRIGTTRETVTRMLKDLERQEQLCFQCHLNSQLVVERHRKSISEYRPGDDLRR